MTMPNMTASTPSPTELSRARPDGNHCRPMAHQNSGGHGHEMYPQQFVRLVGCHDAGLEGLRKSESEKLH